MKRTHMFSIATVMYTENCIFFVCALAVVSAATESKGMIQNVVDACAVEQGYPADKYANFVSDFMNIKLDDCVAACAMKTLGTMSEDGVFTGEKAKFLMAKSEMPEDDDEEMDRVIDTCAIMYGRGGKNSCETARNLHICYDVFLQRIMHNEWNINGLVNQVLLFTFEDYADAYPVRTLLVRVMNDEKTTMKE